MTGGQSRFGLIDLNGTMELMIVSVSKRASRTSMGSCRGIVHIGRENVWAYTDLV